MRTKIRKYSCPVINTGSISLLVTFIVLCLSIFAALSLSGALREYQYSQRIAQHNTDYYLAVDTATDMLRSIDNILSSAYSQDPEHYYETAREQLAPIVDATENFTSGHPSVIYEVSIGSSQALRVVLALNPPGQMQEGYYRITSWQEVTTTQWDGDDSLNLMTF